LRARAGGNGQAGACACIWARAVRPPDPLRSGQLSPASRSQRRPERQGAAARARGARAAGRSWASGAAKRRSVRRGAAGAALARLRAWFCALSASTPWSRLTMAAGPAAAARARKFLPRAAAGRMRDSQKSSNREDLAAVKGHNAARRAARDGARLTYAYAARPRERPRQGQQKHARPLAPAAAAAMHKTSRMA
jgi:hypothetical protein